jgi:hypothetical protein
MEPKQKTVIATRASQGIGAGVVQVFLRGATMLLEPRGARRKRRSYPLPQLALIDGDIGRLETAQKVAPS